MRQVFLALLCIAVCGCQPPYDATREEPNESWTEWTDGQLVSIVSDSLAVLKICKYKKKTWYEWGPSGSQEHYEITDSRTGLFLVNYRSKQKPLLGDTLLAATITHASESFGGFGISVHPGKKGANVASVLPNSPAAQAGLQAGDVIVYINGTLLSSIATENMPKHPHPHSSVITANPIQCLAFKHIPEI